MAYEVGGVEVPLKVKDELDKGLKKAEGTLKKSVDTMDKHLMGLTKSFRKLATDANESLNSINKGMSKNLTAIEGMSNRLNSRLVAMQTSNRAAISAQTNLITRALEDMNRRSVSSIDQVGRAVSDSGGYYDSLIGRFRSLAVNVWIAVSAFRSLGSAIVGIFKPGFDFTAQMETTTLGTAGILTSMFTLNGKTLEWGQALGISKKLMNDIADDALVTTSTVQELAQVFQAVLAPAANAGWNVDQIREFAKVGSNAVKAIGLPAQQVVQELRDLVMGGIRPASSTLAASLGINDATVKQWKEAGTLFTNLMERLQGFTRASKETQNSFAGLFSNIQDGLQRVTSISFAPVFDQFKTELKSIQDLFFTIKQVQVEIGGKKVLKDVAEFNPQTVAFFKEIGATVLGLVTNIKIFWSYFGKDIVATLISVKDNFSTIVTLIATASIITKAWIAPFSALFIVINLLVVAFGGLQPLLKYVSENINLVIGAMLLWRASTTILGGVFSSVVGGMVSQLQRTILAWAGVASATKVAEGAVISFGAAAKAMLITTVVGAVVLALAYLTQKLIEFRNRFAPGTIDATGKTIIGSERVKTGQKFSKSLGKNIDVYEDRPIYKEDVDAASGDTAGLAVSKVNDGIVIPKVEDLNAKYPVGAEDSKGAEAARKAAIAELKEALQERLELLKKDQKELDYQKQENLISITDYWSKTLDISKKGLKAEIETLELEKQYSKDEANLHNIDKEIKKKKIQLAEVEIDTKRKLAKDMKAFNKELVNIEKEYMDKIGGLTNERIKQISESIVQEKYADQYKQIINMINSTKFTIANSKDTAEISRAQEELKKYNRALEELAKLMKVLSVENISKTYIGEFNRQSNLYSANILRINALEKEGSVTSIEADRVRLLYFNQVKDALQDQINKLEELKKNNSEAFGPERQAELLQLRNSMRELQMSTEQTARAMGTSMANSIANAFGSIISGTATVADAFKNMANAIISELLRVLVVQRIVAMILKAMGLSGGGGTDNGTLSYDTPTTKAGGGAISGAGTSTSDSIPAMLSHGEFVVKASSVKQLGLSSLNYINNFGRLPKFALGGAVGYANGGVVKSSGGIENIKVEIINRSGQPLKISDTQTTFDQTTMTISSFIDGVGKNTLGVRDLLKGVAR